MEPLPFTLLLLMPEEELDVEPGPLLDPDPELEEPDDEVEIS
jgi:hypothetical protein